MILDTRDPAIPLNYAVMLAAMRNTGAATEQLRNFEQRVLKLRQSNLDADSEVLLTASKLATTIGYSLGIPLNIKESQSPAPEAQGRSRQAEMEREAKIRSKTARAALRARSKEEATDAQPEHDSHTKAELDKTGAQTSS